MVEPTISKICTNTQTYMKFVEFGMAMAGSIVTTGLAVGTIVVKGLGKNVVVSVEEGVWF